MGLIVMLNDMVLNISDFGPIDEANIEIGRINVVVGKNGTGKSTFSKILYCFLNAASDEGVKLANKSIRDKLSEFIFHWSNKVSEEYHDEESKLKKIQFELSNHDLETSLEKEYDELFKLASNFDENFNNQYSENLKEIGEVINFNKNKTQRYIQISNVLFAFEFDFCYTGAKIKFYGTCDEKNFENTLTFNNDGIEGIVSGKILDNISFSKVIYIDSPSIFEINYNNVQNNNAYHLNELYRKLLPNEDIDVYDNVYNKDLIDFNNKLNGLLNGRFKFDYNKNEFVFISDKSEYLIKNTASGLKQLGIIQLLLENRGLTKNSFLIIDEPEVNLHPEWQIKFAEILILLVKKLNISLYINTHSPFLTEAIEVYSKYYSLDDEVNFYLTEESGKNKCKFKRIPLYDAVEIYDNLGNPFDEIEKIRLKTELKEDMG